jgi:glycosyltransferase involved in cell wall biosynthesis
MNNLLSKLNIKPCICFVSHFAYGALASIDTGHIGGVERQISMMARWFAKRGYEVSMLTWDEGQEDGVEIDGVKVFKLCRKDEGIKGMRFFWPRWTSLNAALRRANADIYYQNCGEYITGQVAMWCRKYNRKFVYSVASDPDCDARLPEMHKLRERVLYSYGLKHADRIIVQTRRQQEMLQTGFGCDSVVIPMPCPGPSESEYVDSQRVRKNSHNILWLGRICEVKRPDRLLDIAQRFPELTFDFVGPQDGTAYTQDVCERAKSIENIKLHGPAYREQVSDFYKNAKIYLCTSDFEGFPNTFLEAWSFGVPIVSTIDPDSVINKNHIGCTAPDVDGLVNALKELINTPAKWDAASKSARRYYLENHTVETVMAKFEQIFCEAADKSTDKIERDNI